MIRIMWTEVTAMHRQDRAILLTRTVHEPSDWETVVVIDAEPAMGGRA